MLLVTLHHAIAVLHHRAHLLHHAHHLGHAALIAGGLPMNPFVLSNRRAGRQQSADNQERDRDGGDAEPVHCFLLATDDRWRSLPLGREATYDLDHAAVKILDSGRRFLAIAFSGALALDAAKIAIFGC
jgi:hypothetical protein